MKTNVSKLLSKKTQDNIWAHTPVVTSQYDFGKQKSVTNLEDVTLR